MGIVNGDRKLWKFSHVIYMPYRLAYIFSRRFWQLSCKSGHPNQHSCQYFVWTLISFLISFSVTSFSISIFLFNNFILYYFYCCVDNCNVDTHAKNIPSLRVHMYRAQDPDQFSVHSLYSTDDARTTARGCRLPTNQGPASYISDQSGASKNSTTWHRKEGSKQPQTPPLYKDSSL